MSIARDLVKGKRVSLPAMKGYELGFLLDVVRQMRTN